MPKSFFSQLASQTGDVVIDRIKKYSHQKVLDMENKQKKDMLGKFFPEDVSDLILSLPENNQWEAIQQLAPSYANVQQEQQMQSQGQQQMGPQGSPGIDQMLRGASGQQDNGQSLMQQVQEPAQGNQQFNAEQSVPRQRKATLGEALGNNEVSKEEKKASQEYVNDVRKRTRKLNDIERNLEKMKKYNNSGKLSGPFASSIVNLAKAGGHGVDLSSLLSRESQGFNKVGVNFLRYAKDYLGTRMTEKEVFKFLEAFPSLTNSKEGRDEIFSIWDEMIASDKAESKALEDIIKANGGRVPPNAEGLVSDAIESHKEQLHQRLIGLGEGGQTQAEPSQGKKIIKELPAASSVPVGKQYRKGGKTYTSNGKSWKVS